MGYYVQTSGHKNKAEQILNKFNGSSELDSHSKSVSEIPKDKGLICIVDNGAFESAAFVYDDKELFEFTDPEDRRVKRWIVMNLNLAKSESGYRD